MKVSLWRGDERRGEATLSEVTGVPSRRGALSGPFLPTNAFAAIWPLFAEYQRYGALVVTAVQSLSPSDAEAMPAALRAALPDGALDSMARAQGALTEAGLELRDGQGGVLHGTEVQVSAWRLFDEEVLGELAATAAAAEAECQGTSIAGYVMIVTGSGPAPVAQPTHGPATPR